MPASQADKDLVQRIRAGDQDAWQQCIDQYEGRLQAFVRGRLRDHALVEDIVQESFIGFLNALPNFHDDTPIQAFLFSIAAHKLTDHLRRCGRRPALHLLSAVASSPGYEPAGQARMASSLARSKEQHTRQEFVIAECLSELIRQWRSGGEYERLKCIELLFVAGRANKEVAAELNISEQAVANHKYFVVSKLKEAAQRSRLPDFDTARLGLE